MKILRKSSEKLPLEQLDKALERFYASARKQDEADYEPGPGCIKPTLKCPLKQVTYESVMGTLTGVAWNALSTLVSYCFTR